MDKQTTLNIFKGIFFVLLAATITLIGVVLFKDPVTPLIVVGIGAGIWFGASPLVKLIADQFEIQQPEEKTILLIKGIIEAILFIIFFGIYTAICVVLIVLLLIFSPLYEEWIKKPAAGNSTTATQK